jgi:hypothetical protein
VKESGHTHGKRPAEVLREAADPRLADDDLAALRRGRRREEPRVEEEERRAEQQEMDERLAKERSKHCRRRRLPTEVCPPQAGRWV